MKEIVIKTQKQLDKLTKVKVGDKVTISTSLRLNAVLPVYGKLIVECSIDWSWNRRYIVFRDNSSGEFWGNSSGEFWDNSSGEFWGNSSGVFRDNSSGEFWDNSSGVFRENSSGVFRDNSSGVFRDNSSGVFRENSSGVFWENSSGVFRGNSSGEFRENSSGVFRDNSSGEFRENSSGVFRDNSSGEFWDNSSGEFWENSSGVFKDNSSGVFKENSSGVFRGNSSGEFWDNSSGVFRDNSSGEFWDNSFGKIIKSIYSSFTGSMVMHGYSILSMPFDLKLKLKKDKTCIVQKYKLQKFLEREGLKVKRGFVILFKKVSSHFKTQEKKANETLWKVGSTVTHDAWNPESGECGKGKFHACSRPYFCDEFRNNKGDVYIAVKIKEKDLHEWTDGSFPHKIAFREGKVLYICDKHGRKI